jgi:hypothetical protein
MKGEIEIEAGDGMKGEIEAREKWRRGWEDIGGVEEEMCRWRVEGEINGGGGYGRKDMQDGLHGHRARARGWEGYNLNLDTTKAYLNLNIEQLAPGKIASYMPTGHV